MQSGNKPRKQKKCKICHDKFIPIRELQPVCQKMSCMIEYSNQHLSKKKKLEVKNNNLRKKEFYDNDKSTLLKKAQSEVNKYARLRDYFLPCISCPTINAKWDGGHYMSAGGHSQLRFYTLNIHKQCFRCNRMQSANLKPYRVNLIKKIGLEKVEEIENNKSSKRYDVEYLQKLICIFRKKNKIMLNRIKDKELDYD